MRPMPLITERVRTATRNEMLDLTPLIQRAIDRNKIREGLAVVFVSHTTAAVTINENTDPDVRHDVLRKLETMIPFEEAYYQHNEGNSDAHVKASLVGHSVTVLIEGGKLQLGRWQAIYLCEFDGPRERRVLVKIINLDPRGEAD